MKKLLKYFFIGLFICLCTFYVSAITYNCIYELYPAIVGKKLSNKDFKYDVILYFGSSIKDPPSEISKEEFKKFLIEYVDPYFEGYTVIYGDGYWKGLKEDSYTIHIMTPSYKEVADKINYIRNKYKEIYHQESVMLEVFLVYGEY